jgi:hypothetical protein
MYPCSCSFDDSPSPNRPLAEESDPAASLVRFSVPAVAVSYAPGLISFRSVNTSTGRNASRPRGLTTRTGRPPRCVVWSHEFGFELRVSTGKELIESRVCHTQEQLIAIQEEWRAAFANKGWS